jgi:hypothetical protein
MFELLRASPLFRAKLARHGLDRGRSSNGAPLQTRQAKFRSRAPHILARGRHSLEPGGTLAVSSFWRIWELSVRNSMNKAHNPLCPCLCSARMVSTGGGPAKSRCARADQGPPNRIWCVQFGAEEWRCSEFQLGLGGWAFKCGSNSKKLEIQVYIGLLVRVLESQPGQVILKIVTV